MHDLEERVGRAEGKYADLKLSGKCTELWEGQDLSRGAGDNRTRLNVGMKGHALLLLHCGMEAPIQSLCPWRGRQRRN